LRIDCVFVDVFTDRPLEGNQLAVVPDASGVPDAYLQPLAREINFSETVYVYPGGDGADARIRIFTPVRELPFAGHPVLGTGFVLAERAGADRIVLATGRGLVPLTFDAAGRGRMVQPLPSVAPLDAAERELIRAAVGVGEVVAPVDVYDNGVRHAYFVLDSVDAVAALSPDGAALARAAGPTGANCVAGAGGAWTTRMFIPGAGVAEDPATGSAAGPLAVHLARHGLAPWGTEITISQGAAIGRPSTLYATAFGTGDTADRVEVAGDSVVVGEATFTLP
jgi:trans-2,3-dihydro-3-hydroxyanthranilate isomerase